MNNLSYADAKKLEVFIIDNIESDLLQVKGAGITYISSLEHFIFHHPEMEWQWQNFFEQIYELFDEENEEFATEFAIETFIKYGNFAILKLSHKEKECPTCDGEGTVGHKYDDGRSDCPDCGGSGKAR